MDRSDLVLAVLSTSEGRAWTPVQVQKIFFLLDMQIPEEIGGPQWEFCAYDYGPFDAAVYWEIDALRDDDLATIGGGDLSRGRTFRLTAAGQRRGKQKLRTLSGGARRYIKDLSEWVRRLSFQSLVSAIYREFPEMKKNSVFAD